MEGPSVNAEDDNSDPHQPLVTESDYEEATECEIANEEVLLRDGIPYYFTVNAQNIPAEIRMMTASPSEQANRGAYFMSI